jgi:hypothetical protein
MSKFMFVFLRVLFGNALEIEYRFLSGNDATLTSFIEFTTVLLIASSFIRSYLGLVS